MIYALKTAIFVITHKLFDCPHQKIYHPIIAGAFEHNKSEFPEDYIRDDSLHNISQKHDLYSEFTALYWIWKNTKTDIVGINHYRRYFINKGALGYLLLLLKNKKDNGFALTKKEVLQIFVKEKYDCVLPKKQWTVFTTVADELELAYPGMADILKDVINKIHPEYSEYYDRLITSHERHLKCLFIMTKEYFCDYAQWMFSIFDELEARGCEGSGREFAFIGEFAMNVWVEYQKSVKGMRVKELYYINSDVSIMNMRNNYNYTEVFLPNALAVALRRLKTRVRVIDGKIKLIKSE